MPVGGRGYVEVYAPKDMSDVAVLALLVANYRAGAVPIAAEKPGRPKRR
jgi:hypothetical protein